MLKKENFPPKKYIDSLGIDFLRRIGLQTNVTNANVHTICQRSGTIKCRSRTREGKQSKSLVSCLRSEHSLHKDVIFVNEVSEINFLFCDRVCARHDLLHPPLMRDGCLTKYNGSITNNNEELVWTIDRLLPGYATNHLWVP